MSDIPLNTPSSSDQLGTNSVVSSDSVGAGSSQASAPYDMPLHVANSGNSNELFSGKPQKKGSMLLIIGLLLLLIALPVGVYFISQKQSLNDIRNRASVYPPLPFSPACGTLPQEAASGCGGGSWQCNSNGGWACYMGGIITGTCGNPTQIGGGDPCTLNGVAVSCSSVGMIRCDCGKGWAAGAAAGNTCDGLCTAAGIKCDGKCKPPHEPPAVNTPTPTHRNVTNTPTNTPLITHTPTNTPTNTPLITHTPTNTPTNTPLITHTPTNTPLITNTPSATPTPIVGCNETCTVNTDCSSGLVCSDSRCRLSQCLESSTCQCATNTNTPTPTPTPIAFVGCNSACTVNTDCSSGLVCIDSFCRNPSCTEKTSCQCDIASAPTPQTPVAGTGPTVLGASVIAGGFLLVLLGLAL